MEEKARELAVTGINRRLDELNNLRSEVQTDRGQFVTRVEYDAKHEALMTTVDTMQKLLDRTEGAVNTWRWIAGFLGVSGVGAIFWALINATK
jgi:hypothetical protein